jgi:hypothetical protein
MLGVYPILEHLKGLHWGKLWPDLQGLGKERWPAKDKHSSLLQTFSNYSLIEFFRIGSRLKMLATDKHSTLFFISLIDRGKMFIIFT